MNFSLYADIDGNSPQAWDKAVKGNKMINLGVDIGGTNVKLALVNTEGKTPEILQKESFPYTYGDYVSVCGNIYKSTVAMATREGIRIDRITALGVAVPGSVDSSNRKIVHAYNAGLHDAPIADELEKLFPGKKAVLANDANAAALAELAGGAFKGKKSAILMTLGTGLGVGLILNGKLFNGGCNRGTEIGHMPFRYGEIPCTCGLSGCNERYANAAWIIDRGRIAYGDQCKEARYVIEKAKNGEKEAVDIIKEYVENLSVIIAGLCSLVDPEVVALGGGISYAGDLLFGSLDKLVQEKNFNRYYYPVVPAQMGNDAGSVGAAMLPLQYMR